jgi:V8-like Glu-specific endopeptidase
LLTGSGKMLKKLPRLIYYNIDTIPGASGAPILVKEEKKIKCVGIHNFGTKDWNIGARLTKGNIK